MKKILLTFLGFTAITLTSCNSKSETSLSYSYSTVNLVTSLETNESEATSGVYDFYLNFTEQYAIVSTNNLAIGKQNYFFTSNHTKFTSASYNIDSQYVGDRIEISPITGYANNNFQLPLSSSDFVVTTMNYFNPTNPGNTYQINYAPAIVAQYTIGNEVSVKTLPRDGVYMGKTITSYPTQGGGTENYENTSMSYRILLDIAKDKADIIIYNARFAEAMPIELSALVISDLDVNWKNGTYSIEGKDVVPVNYEGTTSTPYPSFIFNSISFQPTNSTLTQGEIKYEVAGRYSAVFNGSYLIEPN